MWLTKIAWDFVFQEITAGLSVRICVSIATVNSWIFQAEVLY